MHKIVSGETPVVGMRVFTNDWEWGTIIELGDSSRYGEERDHCGTYCEAWHRVSFDDGHIKSYNCDRLTTVVPK